MVCEPNGTMCGNGEAMTSTAVGNGTRLYVGVLQCGRGRYVVCGGGGRGDDGGGRDGVEGGEGSRYCGRGREAGNKVCGGVVYTGEEQVLIQCLE